jgi:O-antigen ligase
MSSSAAGRAGQPPKSAPLISTLFFLAPLATAVAPRLAPFFLPIIGLVLIVGALRRRVAWRELVQPNTALIGLVSVALYAILSATWAADQSEAVTKGAMLLGITFLVFAATAALATLDERQVRRASIAFLVGASLAAIFVTIELLTDGAVTRAAMNSISLLKPERAKHVKMSKGLVTKMNLSEFNQNVAMLSLQLWPGLLALRAVEAGARRIVLMILFFLLVAVPIAISEHDSSQVALIVSLLVLPLARRWPRPTVRGLAIAWCLGFVLVLPLDFLSYKAELYRASWLPSSARARIIIWEYTAERTLDHPWLGIGADSTAAVKAQRVTQPEKPKGYVIRRTTGQHAHDLFLQAWYELGLFGVILLAIAGAAMVLRIPLLPREAQPFAAACFTTFVTIAAFAWGIWQVWLMCAVALMPLYMAMAAARFRTPREELPPDGTTPASR